MYPRLAFALAIGLAGSVRAEAPPAAVSPEQGRKAIGRGLDFIRADAAKWRKEHTCSTCHHGTMTVWALVEARSRGLDVPADALADATKWTRERLDRIDLPRDTRPGWSMVSTPALYLAVMAAAVPNQDAVSADELKRIAGHLVRHQEADGSWAWSSAPAQNRPPPVFESDEIATRLAMAALASQVPADPKAKSEVREARTKGDAWLAKVTPSDTTQALAVRLLVKALAGDPTGKLKPDVDGLISRQSADGGWGQVAGAAADGYATGQALYALAQAGVPGDRTEVRRGVAFLVRTQKDDGSWPMTPRAHPGAHPAKNLAPITYLGSAWATLGLLRSVPK